MISLIHPKRLLNLTRDRLPTLPLLVLYLTDGCNSKCAMCDIWRSPRRNMDMALVEQITGECGALGVSRVLFSGGEAMQHPQWAEIAQRFRAEGVHVMLLTNGLLVRKQLDAVLATVDELVVSLDAATPETYAAIRGVDALDLVIDGIQAARAGGVPVTTRTTIQRANYQEIPQIIARAKAADVNRISFLAVDISNPFAFGPRFSADSSIPITISSSPTLNPAALTLEDVRALSTLIDDMAVHYAEDFASGRIVESPDKLRRILVRYFDAILGTDTFPAPPCNAPHFSVVVNVDGTLQPCYFLPTIGRISSGGTGLRDALNTDVAQNLRRAYRIGERQECARCVCPLYRGPRALLQL